MSVPETLGRYQIKEEIGIGGMGTVYRAIDTTIEMEVAIKILHEHLRSDEKAATRFFNDAKALGKLKHQNIVQIYGTEMEHHYFVMELLKGRSLKDAIKENGPLDPKRAVAIGHQVADSLKYIHESNLIHRDIKPHNVIIDENDRAKLLDFGVAREKNSQMTTGAAVLGTLEYMSPEQIAGAEDIDQRTDIYSLGVLMYECLTGQVPFPPGEDSAVWQVVERISNSEPKRVIEINPRIPPYLDEIVMKCLEKERSNRRSSMGELMVELENAQRVLEGSMSTIYRTGDLGGIKAPFWKKKAVAAGLAVVLLGALGGGVAVIYSKNAATSDDSGQAGDLSSAVSAPNRSSSGAASSRNVKSPSGGSININTATASELGKLPGVGPKTAESIIEYRDENGNFKAPADLMKVKGIGPKKYEGMSDFVTVE